jgi:uncharacterized protein with PIN domain
MKIIKFIAALIIFTVINVGASIYFYNTKPATQTDPAKHINVSYQDRAMLSAMIDRSIKESLMRDTVIAQQVMRIQHKLEMHKQRMPLCPDCVNRLVPNTKYHYTKDDSL